MTLDLPEGITFNNGGEDLLSVELPYQQLDVWKCSNCSYTVEAIIIGSEGRYQGSIKPLDSEITSWHGKLPKNESKAKNYLKEILEQRITRHKGNH